MAGIYIHIPFCRKACFYCDFHFSVSLGLQTDIVDAIVLEAKRRKHFLGEEKVETVYFGGGTPSVLTISEWDQILGTLHEEFTIDKDAEITVECNPDDLTAEYLKMLKLIGVNRLSVGIQSFNEEHLKWMNRSHTAEQSLSCIQLASDIGFKDITIDLIYGLPQLDVAEWKQTVKSALALPINHLSAYSLTLEENTPYQKLVSQTKYKRPDDDLASEHYDLLITEINEHGWEHYEVSNFCKAGNHSKHNTAYWQGKKYLGLGPSAHSYDGASRYWNISSNKEYLSLIASNNKTYEMEELTAVNRLNEYLLTGLRAKWGVDTDLLKKEHHYDIEILYAEELNYWLSIGWIERSGTKISLTDKGLLFADFIASELFSTEDEDYSSQMSS
jgi:oxygen-independent coproporphyrinogen-3 oxidase